MNRVLLALFIGGLWMVTSNLSADDAVPAVAPTNQPAAAVSKETPAAPTAATESKEAPATPAAATEPKETPATPPAAAVKETPATPTAVTEPKEAPVVPAQPGRVQQESERAVREEIIRRQEAQLAGRKLIADGEKLSAEGKHDQAVAKFTEALKILPVAKATEADYSRGVEGIARANNRLAEAALDKGDWDTAQQLAEKSLRYDATNRGAEGIIIRAKRGKAKIAATAAKAKEPTPDQTPEFLNKRKDIRQWFREGKILYSSGQYDAAENRFQQVLVVDPYNEDAHLWMGEVNKARERVAEVGADMARSRRLREVTEAWIPTVGREIKLPEEITRRSAITAEPRAVSAINDKLNKIKIPEINFREANINDVIGFLSDESRKRDTVSPEGEKGVNFVLHMAEAGGTAAFPTPVATPPMPAPGGGIAPGAAPAAGEAGAPPPPPPVAAEPEPAAGGHKITLSLRNIPLIDALKYVTSVAGLKYRVEASAVLILPKDAPEGGLITRTYPLSPGAISRVVAAPSTEGLGGERAAGGGGLGGGGGGGGTFAKEDMKAFFTEAGVPFPSGSSLSYNDRTSTIIVRNTPENLETFEQVLASLNVRPSQIEIEAKFIDIAQSDLDELGFRWSVGRHVMGDFDVEGGSPSEAFPPGPQATKTTKEITQGLRDSTQISGNALDSLLQNGVAAVSGGGGTAATAANQLGVFRGILTDPQFQVIIQALAQKKGSDVLSAPKITTINGNAAQIRVVQEFIYPTEYQAPQVAENVSTPPIPGGFKTRELGVLLNVTPTVGPDGYTINLTLVPEVSEFLGFINYSPGETVNRQIVQSTVAGGQAQIIENRVPNTILQPLFSSRNLTTSVLIWDGQTVVLGGLIREEAQRIDDKVPFLGDIPVVGRLFRSKSTSRSKRNLLIFVSARLIDPAGNLIHKMEPIAVGSAAAK